MSKYQYWGESELMEKCENSELFAREIAQYFREKIAYGLTKQEVYLLEKARKLGELK